MRKTISVLMIVSMLFVSSQAISQAQFAIGLKGGPNIAKIDTEGAGATYQNRTGFHLGAFTLIKFSKVGIQPELIFSQQGSRFTYSGSPTLESNFSYLNIPVLLKLYTIAGINVQFGPQFGFLMKAVEERAGAAPSYTEQDVKKELKKSDLSLGLGLGWDLPFGVTLDARYNLGLSKLNDQPASPDMKNQVFQFSLGYKFLKLGE